jgi:anti-sigma B factor antagonist
MAVPLQIQLREAGEVTILDLQGRATIGAGNDLLSSKLRGLIEGGTRKLLVNLAGLTQIDSSGISSLVRAFVSLNLSGGNLKLAKPSGRVRDVLQVTRLLDAIPAFDDEATALASFR